MNIIVLYIYIYIYIIIPGLFIKRRKLWFGPHHINDALTFLKMMGRECSRLDHSYQRHITNCMYRLLPTTPPSPSGHYYPRPIAGTSLPTRKDG